MLIRKTTAILAAIFLVTIVKANATPSEFCGDRYCGSYHQGQSHQEQIRYSSRDRGYKHHSRHHKPSKAKAHSVKPDKPVQVASIGKEPISEAPADKSLLAKASSYLGTNPTGWRSLWCARFIAFISPATAEALKRMGLNPNWARDYAELPGAKHNGKVGDLVVLSRGRGGHIGIVAAFKGNNPIIISGNHGHKVGKGMYPARRVLAYVTL